MITKATDQKLPADVRKKWKGSKVYVYSTATTYFVKKMEKSVDDSVVKRLREAGKGITSKDLQKAIRAARA